MQRLKAAMSLPSCLPDLTEGEVQKAKPQKRRATKVLRNTSSKKQKNLSGKLPNIDFPLVLPGQELSPTIAEVTRLGTQYCPSFSEIIFGGDFSGMEIAFEAAEDLIASGVQPGIRLKHAWSSDIDSACQRFLKQNRPGHVLPSVKAPLPYDVPAVNFYFAGFPCQPYSREGKGLGLQDANGKLFWDMLRRLETIKGSLSFFVLENTSNLATSARHKADFHLILEELKALLGGFTIEWRVLDARDFGLVQTRKRLYIVGIKSCLQVTDFRWPQPQPVGNRSALASVLEPPPVLSCCEQERRAQQMLSKTGLRNLRIALADIIKHGHDPMVLPFAIDVDTGRVSSKLWKQNEARALTRSRGGSGGPWLSSHWRRMSLDELAALQGLSLQRYNLTGVSQRQLGQMFFVCSYVFRIFFAVFYLIAFSVTPGGYRIGKA